MHWCVILLAALPCVLSADYIPPNDGDPDIHFVFSSDCKPYQNWQAIALWKSAQAVGQKGVFTRVASGCEKGGQPWIDDVNKMLKIRNARVHFTPGYDDTYNDAYPPYNRPYGLAHWLLYAYPPITEKTIVVIDPDMMFLRPFLNGAQSATLFSEVTPNRLEAIGVHELTDKVIKGRPLGAFYGIGAKFLHYEKPYDLSYFCKRTAEELETLKSGSLDEQNTAKRLTQECNALSNQDGWDYFNVGPPYAMHLDDFTNILPFWMNFTRDTRKAVPELIAEMYAYSLAAAHLGLKHIRLNNLIVSDVRPSSYGEAWDKMSMKFDPCENGRPPNVEEEPMLPNWIHMAQRYAWDFHKRHVPWDILECDAKMLQHPPKDMFQRFSEVGPLEYCNDALDETKKARCQKRGAWMTCTVIPKINDAILDWKKEYCPAGFNDDMTSYVLQNPKESYGRPKDACDTCAKKFDGGAYKESNRAKP